MIIAQLLALNLAAAFGLFVLLWLVSIPLKDPSFIDAFWAFGLTGLAWTSFLFTGQKTGPHAVLLLALVTVWGLRLGGYLFWRWRKHGADRRYEVMMGKAKTDRGWDYPLASFLLVFALQAPLQWVVSLPVQLGQLAEPGVLQPLAWAGAALAIIGIAFETIGDAQLVRFKADPANAGKVLSTGLWRYTRHPNYFGDACLWWGLWLIAADTGAVGVASIVGPVLLTFLLTRWSGVPTTEGRMRRKKPDYEAYVARTSAFVPWPPMGPRNEDQSSH
jgi:steroid 5-alpha reductase family enzyme